ncbi:uncharacterized protein LOC125507210 [Triticum urartu]|uniref:uncharacterized protein LOC125507210 n=1 Tax=Triticum urartu TaxID=4572 RepID=UPI002043A0DB|nr:uncharacterized protein LOC125507210 [Triticum urartu]
MIAKSGFTLDANRKIIQCGKAQYEAYCKIHNEAKGLYGVPFLYFERLDALYGKIVATMENVKGFGETVVNLQNEIAKSKGKASCELTRLSFIGCEIVEAASVFAKAPDHMNMMLMLPENLRREFILKLLADDKRS